MIPRHPRSTRPDTPVPYTTLFRSDDIDDPAVAALGDRLTIVPAADNLADSVLAVAALAIFPLLITTADNCLLTPEPIAEIHRDATRLGAEARVALAQRAAAMALHPEGLRRCYDHCSTWGSYCNAHWLGHIGYL